MHEAALVWPLWEDAGVHKQVMRAGRSPPLRSEPFEELLPRACANPSEDTGGSGGHLYGLQDRKVPQPPRKLAWGRGAPASQ